MGDSYGQKVDKTPVADAPPVKMVIKPTVGRVVWFHRFNRITKVWSGPLAAHVCKVNDDGTVNLFVLSELGCPQAETDCLLLQDGDAIPDPKACGVYCEWMPYQKQVASGQTPAVLHATETESK